MGCFAINAHDGFGAAETDEHPAAIFQFKLKAVYRNQLGDFQSADCFWIRFQDGFFAGFPVAAERCVDAIIIMRANFIEQHLKQFGWLLAGARHKVEHI